MSVNQFVSELEAVTKILDEHVAETSEVDEDDPVAVEQFAARWQAVELLSRSHFYITAQINAELAQQAIVLPDPVPKLPSETKASLLYGPDGKPIA